MCWPRTGRSERARPTSSPNEVSLEPIKHNLLNVPQEVRSIIYDFAFTLSTTQIIGDEQATYANALPPRLSQVCRQIRREIQDIYRRDRQDQHQHPHPMVAFWRDSPFQHTNDPALADRMLGETNWLALLYRPSSCKYKRLLIHVTTTVGPGPPCWRYGYSVTIYGSRERSKAKPLEEYAVVMLTDVGSVHRPRRPVASLDAEVIRNSLPLGTCLKLLKDVCRWFRKDSCGTTEEAAKLTMLDTVQALFRVQILRQRTSIGMEGLFQQFTQTHRLVHGIKALGYLTRRAMDESGQSIVVARARAHHNGRAGTCSEH